MGISGGLLMTYALHFGDACMRSSLVLARCLRSGGENRSTTRSRSVGILRKDERDVAFGECDDCEESEWGEGEPPL